MSAPTPGEVINGWLERLRGSAPGFGNLTNCIARSLFETGGFRPQLLHLNCEDPANVDHQEHQARRPSLPLARQLLPIPHDALQRRPERGENTNCITRSVGGSG